MKLSPYTRVINLDEDSVCLYNTADRSLVAMPSYAISNGEIVDTIGDENIELLSKMGFFLSRSEACAKGRKEADNSYKLFLSIELNRSCNLRCPYCYQGNSKDCDSLSGGIVELVVRYCEQVLTRRPYTDIYLKVLGGEPTLAKSRFLQLNSAISDFCSSKGIRYHLLVDTNGTNIELFGVLRGYDSILFTIPLTHQKCHDELRRYSDGTGTYLKIIDNVNKLNNLIPQARIILRHNTDANNIELFEEYLDDLKTRCSFEPWISLNYTANLNGDSFENGLSYSEFVKWSSADAINHLLHRNLPVLMSPLTSIEECQYRSRYSLKLFSDGTVGNCAMDYTKPDRSSLEELICAIEEDTRSSFLMHKENSALAGDEECMKCESLFLCGGTKKLPCIQAINSGPCRHSSTPNIDIDEFIRTYYAARERGLGHLFVVFEGKEGYR